MHFLTWLSQHAIYINVLWWFTFSSMVLLYIACNHLPDKVVGNILPLHNVFRPKMNLDLDYQSVGYAMLHTKWFARITHYTIILDSLLWFVFFNSVHWSVAVIMLGTIVVQSFFIGEKKFGVSFVLMGVLVYAGSILFISYLGMTNAVLLAKVILMTGGLVRMVGHSVEYMPPLLLENSDKFVKLTPKNITWKIPVVALLGYIAEFSSGLPNRLMPVQVNFLYQKIFRVTPETTMPWPQIEAKAKRALEGGYTALNSLGSYYATIVGEK